MTLRMRRRRNRTELLREAVREGRDQASKVAAKAVERGSEVAAERLGRRNAPRHRRAAGSLVALMLLAALATGLYLWWQRRRADEEYARLARSPERPDVSPAAPPAPSAAPEPTGDVAPPTPIATRPVVPAQSPPSIPVPAAEAFTSVVEPAPALGAPFASQVEQAPRANWNAHTRESPVLLLPSRPSIPFRAAPTPQGMRAPLPGGGRALF